MSEENAAATPKQESSSSEHISIHVTDGATEVIFKIKKTTPLRKVMDAFCKRTGKDPKGLRFLHDGERISESDTPEKVRVLKALPVSYGNFFLCDDN